MLEALGLICVAVVILRILGSFLDRWQDRRFDRMVERARGKRAAQAAEPGDAPKHQRAPDSR